MELKKKKILVVSFVSSQSIDIRWFVCHLNELYMHVDIVL